MAAPTVQTVEAEAITNNEAILRGYCWDVGSDSIFYISFGYGDSYEDYGNWTWGSWLLMTHYPRYWAWKATGLSADHLYHFAVCGANNLDETMYGGDLTFRTRAAAPVGTAGHFWVEGNYWCYIDSAGYKRKVKGEG